MENFGSVGGTLVGFVFSTASEDVIGGPLEADIVVLCVLCALEELRAGIGSGVRGRVPKCLVLLVRGVGGNVADE